MYKENRVQINLIQTIRLV